MSGPATITATQNPNGRPQDGFVEVTDGNGTIYATTYNKEFVQELFNQWLSRATGSYVTQPYFLVNQAPAAPVDGTPIEDLTQLTGTWKLVGVGNTDYAPRLYALVGLGRRLPGQRGEVIQLARGDGGVIDTLEMRRLLGGQPGAYVVENQVGRDFSVKLQSNSQGQVLVTTLDDRLLFTFENRPTAANRPYGPRS